MDPADATPSDVTPKPSERQIRDRLVAEVARAVSLSVDDIDVREPFATYRMGSIEAVQVVAELEDWLGIALDDTLLWDHPTIEGLARHLAASVKSA